MRSTGLTTFPIQHHYSSKLKAFRPCVWIRGQLLNSLTGLRRLWAAPAIGKSPLQIGTDSATPASAFGPGIRPSKWSRSARRWGTCRRRCAGRVARPGPRRARPKRQRMRTGSVGLAQAPTPSPSVGRLRADWWPIHEGGAPLQSSNLPGPCQAQAITTSSNSALEPAAPP